MPVGYLRRVTGRQRTAAANRHLACFLAFVAGAVNAGGYLAVRQYTSHMSGIVSSAAGSAAVGDLRELGTGLGSVLAFAAGAAVTAMLVNWGRRRSTESVYMLPLLLEAMLLVCFALVGGRLEREWMGLLPATVVLLCFTMGLQNAMITKVSGAVIRTTHVTGMVTDIGIELGKAMYPARGVGADWAKLRLLGSLVGLFFAGGVFGAVGFRRDGFVSALPLAGLLVVLTSVPVLDDLRKGRAARS